MAHTNPVIMDTTHIPLGKTVTHSTTYDPTQLFPVERQLARHHIGIEQDLPFIGRDIWTAYEISWLNPKGKPVVAIGEIIFDCNTPHIVESKSLKLYLNSFNQTRFESMERVQEIFTTDLSRIAGGTVQVRLLSPEQFYELTPVNPEGQCIDTLDVEIQDYQINKELLGTGTETVGESLYSNLLRTNCPVTGQPDWATIVISYHGKQIEQEGLLRYLISYREHTGFHENCVESVYVDIMDRCRPDSLSVYARFTRRGGIDINPYRSSDTTEIVSKRLFRQ